jgi:Domain of Unknown Function (DUF1540)
MKQLIDMPEVIECEVDECAYNVDFNCHARAITVGNMQKHLCDTMIASVRHTHREAVAGVGACRSFNCIHNEDFECQAEGINVTRSGGMVQCGTFTAQ